MNAPVTLPLSRDSYAQRLAAVMPLVPKLEAILGGIFPGPIVTKVEEDPEIEGYRYLIFQVETRESVKEVLAREQQWFDRSRDLLGANCDLVMLYPVFLE